MNQNKTIKQLVANREKVWVYLESETICKKFFKQAKMENFSFGELPYEKWVCGTLIAVHSNGQMGHAPYFVYSLLHSKKDIVDFRKYLDDDYKM